MNRRTSLLMGTIVITLVAAALVFVYGRNAMEPEPAPITQDEIIIESVD